MTDPKRSGWNHDDEEEEGMLKVDEEGQIEDDKADHQVSHPSRPSNEARPVSLADRLMPLSDASPKKAGSSAPSSSTNTGYVSPRHANVVDRDRDRDRYPDTSPGPSSSSYVPIRSRFGYPAETGASYGAAAAYPYPSNHREPIRAEPFASGSRPGFSGSAPRAENRRGWYPTNTTPRGPDTYRPGAIRDRERERERDWDSFRDGDRDREWAGMDRDRERDSYRDVADKRRDWHQRERGAGSSTYDLADTHPPYPTAAGSKYGFDNRDFPGRRPTSPPSHPGREREFDPDRSRDRDRDRPSERDQRMRAPSSGWGNGMRQWGKPSDAGWDSRSGRRPASDDARSDTSHRQSGSRSNNTPPPAASSEPGARPIGSDNASEKSEARSRELSPHPPRSRERDAAIDKAADATQTEEKELGDEAKKANEVSEEKTEQKEQKERDEAVAPVIDSKADQALEAEATAPAAAETLQTESKDPVPSQPVAEAGVVPASAEAHDKTPAEKPASAVAIDTSADLEASVEQAAVPPVEMQTSDAGDEAVVVEKQRLAVQTAEPAIQSETAVAADETEATYEADAKLDQKKEASIKAEDTSAEETPSSTNQQPVGTDDAAEAQEQTNAPAGAEATSRVEESASAAILSEAAEAAPISSTVPVSLTSTQTAPEERADEPMKVESAAAKTEAHEQPVEAAPQKASKPEAVQDETSHQDAVDEVMEKIDSGAAASADAEPGVSAEPPVQAHNDAPALAEPSIDVMTSEAPTTTAAAPAAETTASTGAVDDVEMPDVVSETLEAPLEATKTEVVEAASLEPAAAPTTAMQAEVKPSHDKVEVPADADAAQDSKPDQLAATAQEKNEEAVVVAQQLEGSQQQVAISTDTLKDAEPQSVEASTAQPATTQAGAIASRSLAAPVLEDPAPSEPSLGDATAEVATSTAAELAPVLIEPNLNTEEQQNDTRISTEEPTAEFKQADITMDEVQPELHAEEPGTDIEQASQQVPAVADAVTEKQPVSAEGTAEAPAQIQVSGPYVTATIDAENKTKEITLPQVHYGNDKEAQALMRQEDARIEEVEMPSADQQGPSLRIAEIDEATSQIEPPLMTPTSQEQVDRAIEFAVRQQIAKASPVQDEWKRVLRDNERLSQRTTMDVLKAKIHGIPQIVSSDRPLWLDEDDKATQRTKAQLFDQLLDRKKRLNEKVESLKKRYRSINEDWKVHCSRLDRIAERREMARRPPVNTPAGTPGGFGVEDPSQAGIGGGLLGASLSTGRANRRSAQAGFAGFGDAVRSEAEFLEILASLENADMQDPNMRAARTTATAPDMHINVDSEQLTKRRYDDINGYVADPLAFYLDKFDPDVWSEEEKAIFARRYALWPKQFGKIAQALPHKTSSQCVRYYYLNKKEPGNDFKALAAARNRERKRKARGKPKKAKGSALMADLKSAKGEEVDDVDDGSGLRSPMDATDPSGAPADVVFSSNGRRGGRGRINPAGADGVAGSTEEAPVGRKRAAEQGESETPVSDAKTSDKRRSGPKSKRAKSDSANATEKSRKSKSASKKDLAPLEEITAEELPDLAVIPPKREATDMAAEGDIAPGSASVATDTKARVEDSDLAAAEALGALAGLFGGPSAGGEELGSSGAASASAPPAAESALYGEVDADGRKVGKKRRSKTAAPGEEGIESTGRGRGKQPTSSYWSVAERSEFLRALVVHGPRWEVVSSTLAQKSTAQARNYFARNEDETDFAEAAALSRSHADQSLAEREAAALAFVRHRFASNAAGTGPAPHLPSAGGAGAMSAMPVSSYGGEVSPGVPMGASRTTHLPPPPGIHPGQTDIADVKMREDSPEPMVQRRGLQINSLLNDSNDAATRTKRRSSLHEWQGERDGSAHTGHTRDASVPPALYARQAFDLDRRPATADRIEAPRPVSSDGRAARPNLDERARAYERIEVPRSSAEIRDVRDMREGSGDSRSWMYDSPYEAHHRRPSPTPGYAPMAPPSHPVERGLPPSRYSMPPSSASGPPHLARSVPPMSSHLHPSEEAEMERERERERDRAYGMYSSSSGRLREHEAHSMPPAVPGESRHASSGEQLSPTSASFGATHGYSRYAPPGVGSMYPTTAAATTALASRGRPANGPLTAPLPPTSDRAAYEQRWQRYSQSPGPSVSSTPAPSAAVGGGFSTGSAYRSSASPYSSFPSQSLPRPSLPSLSATGPKVGAPHLPSLGAAGRSLPPILGSFPAPGRSGLGGSGSRPSGGPGAGEEATARYWPYPHRPPRSNHDQAPSSNRNPE